MVINILCVFILFDIVDLWLTKNKTFCGCKEDMQTKPKKIRDILFEREVNLVCSNYLQSPKHHIEKRQGMTWDSPDSF